MSVGLSLPPPQPRCGLPINPYFSALKVCWLMENCEQVRAAIEDGRCLFGTVDTWLIWVRQVNLCALIRVLDIFHFVSPYIM